MERGKFIAGNWKMNKGATESLAFLGKLTSLLAQVKGIGSLVPDPVNVTLFPQAINLLPMGEYLRNSKIDIKLGIQNIHWAPSGAFTGENSIKSAIEAGSSFALVGHSERRHLFQESPGMISKKFTSCLENGLKPVLCVGETEQQKDQGSTEKVIADQVRSVFTAETLVLLNKERVYIAYEPVWAIGTGLNATGRDAQRCCRFIRSLLSKIGGTDLAARSLLAYGGSVKSSNSRDYLDQEDVDGLLIGGASLDLEEFFRIVQTAFSIVQGLI
jgi:triosephosphate isomerase